MALPHARDFTPVANDVAGGSVLMSIQHWLARFFKKNARLAKSLVLSPFGVRDTGWVTFAPGAATMYVAATAGAAIHRIPLLLKHGAVISSVSYRYWRNAGANLSGRIARYSLTAVGAPAAVHGPTTLSGGPGAFVTTTDTSGGFTVDQAYAYFVEVTSGQASDRLVWVKITFAHTA